MMKTVFRKAECLLALSMLMTAPALAQSADSVAVAQDNAKLELSLEDAKKYALEHNRTIQNASYDVKKAEAARWQTIASMLPQVSGTAQYANMCGYEMEMMGMKIAMPAYFDLGISATMTVGGQQIVATKINKMAIEMSQIGVAKTEQVIKDNIENSYISILAMQKTLTLLEGNVANLDSMHKMTMNAVRVGAAEQNTADKVAIQISLLKSSCTNTKRNIEVLYNTIRLLIGAAADSEITLTQTFEDVINVESILAITDQSLALGDNYDYQLQNATTNLAKKKVTLSKMEYVPTLTAFYNMDKKKYCSDEATMNTTPPNVVGFQLNVPIWSSGSRAAGVRSAKIDYQKELNNLEDTKLNLSVQESQYRYDLLSAYENYEIQGENIDLILRLFKSNSEKFKYGTISSVELTNSSTDLINAQSTYLQAVTQMSSAFIKLRALLNK